MINSSIGFLENVSNYFWIGKERTYEKTADGNVVVFREHKRRSLALDSLKIISYLSILIPIIMISLKSISEYKIKNLRFEIKNNLSIEDKKTHSIASSSDIFKKQIEAPLLSIFAQKELNFLQREKRHLSLALKELVDTEQSFVQNLEIHLIVMNKKKFEKILPKGQLTKDFQQYRDRYLLTLSESIKFLQKLEGIISSNPDQKSMEQVIQEIEGISALYQSQEFSRYLHTLETIGNYSEQLFRLVPHKKASQFAIDNKLMTTHFDPCYIASQKLMRIPLMLDNLYERLRKMGRTSDSLEKALTLVKDAIEQYNRNEKS